MLAKRYKTLDNLISASFEELVNIKDIGETIAISIKDYFNNEENIKIINKLKEHNVNMEYLGEDIQENELFTDKTFVITGTLTNPREIIKDKIESVGGKVTDSVSKKTDYLVLGENPGSKYDKAKALGIKIIKEEELDSMFGGNNG